MLALIFVLAGSCVLGSSVLQGQSGGVQREASLACARMRKRARGQAPGHARPGHAAHDHNQSPQPITTTHHHRDSGYRAVTGE